MTRTRALGWIVSIAVGTVAVGVLLGAAVPVDWLPVLILAGPTGLGVLVLAIGYQVLQAREP